MKSLGVICVLGLVVCINTAPESERPDQTLVTGPVLESNPESHKTQPGEVGADLTPVYDDEPEVKSSGVKKGDLDRGLVSDVIESTLGGMQLGFAIGGNNGTLDRLCIKLGNITMAGCRRTASLIKKASTEDEEKIPEKSKK